MTFEKYENDDDDRRPAGGAEDDGRDDDDADAAADAASRPAPARRARGAPAAGGAGGRERVRVGDRVTIYRDRAVSPKWGIQYNVDGRQVRRSLKTAVRKRAEIIARRKDDQLARGEAEHPDDARPVTLAAAREQYLASLKTRARSPKTLQGYASKLAVFEAFCETRHVRYLRRATAQLLEAYQGALQETGVVPRGPKTPGRRRRRGPGFKAGANMARTVRDKMKVVRQLIKWARKRGLLKTDPAAGYDLPPAVKAKAHCWSPADLAAIRAHAPAGMLDLFDFLRLTGLRAEELCWLTKDDLDVERPHVKIRAKACPLGSGRAWRPKHGSERVVPLCPEALAIARRAASSSAGPWLFYAPGTHGAQPGLWRKNRLWKAVKAAMRAGGVARGTTHTFRHAFCSFLARRGVSPFAIMAVMGHDSLEIVLQYCHTSEQDLLDAIGAVPFGEMLGAAAATPATAPASTPVRPHETACVTWCAGDWPGG